MWSSGPYERMATPRSDVDLFVDSGLRGLAFFGLLDGVVSVLDVPVDLIDASQADKGSPIEREIGQSGVQNLWMTKIPQSSKRSCSIPFPL